MYRLLTFTRSISIDEEKEKHSCRSSVSIRVNDAFKVGGSSSLSLSLFLFALIGMSQHVRLIDSHFAH
jgi:hypothetical protein